MIILTNPGSNLDPELVARYQIELTPQKIVVDGVEHDTREGISFEQIDQWVRTARTHPYVLGTSAAEFAGFFRELSKRDREIVAVMTSRKLIGSHDSAVSAARAFADQPGNAGREIRVLDSGFTDLGAGLACVMAAEANRAGLSTDRIAALMEIYRTESRFALVADTLDYLVKGGRATPLRAWFANVLGVRPHIGMAGGEIHVIGKVGANADRAEAIATHMASEIGARRPVWIGVFHGNARVRAEQLRTSLEKRFDVRFGIIRPLAPSIYLHMGPGAVGAIVVPVDKFPSFASPR